MTTRRQDTVRFDSPESTGAPLDSLITATSEPPFCGESVVLDAAGHCLAQAIDIGRGEDGKTRFAWAISGIGCLRIEQEARGQIRGAA